jgi:hypothetical protein
MAEQDRTRSAGAAGGAVMTEQEIAAMTTAQLRGWLTDHGVRGTSSMRKEELVKTAVKTMRSDQATTGRAGTAKKSAAGGTADMAARPTKRVTGTARQAAVPETGEDVIDLLLADHDQIRMLFAELGRTRGEHRQEIWTQLCRLLAVHESIEQHLVHPLAEQRLPDGESVVRARVHEERKATRELLDLWAMGIDHPGFEAGLTRLRDAVIEHAELEESEEFGWLRDNVPADRLIRLAGVAQATERIPPGPPADVLDRVRDVLRDAARNDTRS